MTNNNLTYFEGMEVIKTRKSQYYKVVFEDGECTIYISEKNVQEICENCQEEQVLVAILLACIEYIRKDTSTDKNKIRKIDEKIVVESTVKLLSDYTAETLILYIKSLKWHEVKEIYESQNPKEMLEVRI